MLHVAPLGFLSFSTGGYVPAGAIWLDGSADYLTWTPSGAGDSQRTFTLSAWVKPNLPTFDNIMSCGTTGTADSDNMALRFTTNGALQHGAFPTTNVLVTSAYHRDSTAWMHVVGVCDTTDGTATNRLKLYVNGVEVTAFATDNRASNPTLNEDMAWGRAIAIQIGRDFGGGAPTAYYEGYMAEVIYLDGVAAAVTDLGKFDANGNWVPIDPSGLTFGTNGFWLDFANSAALGTDASGNGNNFTVNSMSSANATNDNPADDATNGYGNFNNWNPASSGGNGSTFSNGNNTWSDASGSGDAATGIIAVSSGKWICEFEIDAVTAGLWLGVWGMETQTASTPFKPWDSGNDIAGDHGTWVIKPSTGYTVDGDGQGDPGTNQSLSTWTATDRLTIAIDMDQGAGSNKMWIAKNGTWENSGDPDGGTGAIFTNLPERVVFVVGNRSSGTDTVTMRADSATWEDSPSNATTFKDLCTANLPVPAVANYEDEYYIEAGISHTNGATTDVTLPTTVSGGAMFRLKRTDNTGSWYVFDTVRGANKFILWDDETAAEDTSTWTDQAASGTTLTLPSALATGTYLLEVFYVGSYFQIKTYTGNGSNRTISFDSAMSYAPGMGFVKKRTSTSYDHVVFHTSIPNTDFLYAHSTAASNTNATVWNSTSPTTTGFTVGTQAGVNENTSTYVSYWWANGGPYAFGSYTGNLNADGPVVYTEGSPASFMTKRNEAGWNWNFHAQALGANENYQYLIPNATTAINATTTVNEVDFLATGYKVRDGDNNNINGSGIEHLYMAFGITPIGGSGISQARAR
jgi:hypothetical protein